MEESTPSPSIRPAVQMLLANRGTPEAAALFERLMAYAHKRVLRVSGRCGLCLVAAEQEEIVADVILQLLQGSLAAFQGDSLPQLLAFVRTITDRTAWRVIRRKDRERETLKESGVEIVTDWTASVAAPDELERVVASPLPQADQEYLVKLLGAGSKAELARTANVSRAAVTQRVQRIKRRINELSAEDQMTHEAWLQRQAALALRGPLA